MPLVIVTVTTIPTFETYPSIQLTGIHSARECGLVHPSKCMIIGNSIYDKVHIVWLNDDMDDSPAPTPSIESLNNNKNSAGNSIMVKLAVTEEVWSYLKTHYYNYAMDLTKFIRVYGHYPTTRYPSCLPM